MTHHKPSSPLAQTAHSTLHTPEQIRVEHDADQVSCDGGGGALGHPKVWYNFGDAHTIECGYCDRVFVK